jgi:hypothetical protein
MKLALLYSPLWGQKKTVEAIEEGIVGYLKSSRFLG